MRHYQLSIDPFLLVINDFVTGGRYFQKKLYEAVIDRFRCQNVGTFFRVLRPSFQGKGVDEWIDIHFLRSRRYTVFQSGEPRCLIRAVVDIDLYQRDWSFSQRKDLAFCGFHTIFKKKKKKQLKNQVAREREKAKKLVIMRNILSYNNRTVKINCWFSMRMFKVRRDKNYCCFIIYRFTFLHNFFNTKERKKETTLITKMFYVVDTVRV